MYLDARPNYFLQTLKVPKSAAIEIASGTVYYNISHTYFITSILFTTPELFPMDISINVFLHFDRTCGKHVLYLCNHLFVRSFYA